MATTTAGLGRYIAKRRYGTTYEPRIFKSGFTHRSSLLKKGRVNRIIFYPGSFNPPHRGHEALLRHAFENTQDINVIAAIILPRDDDTLDRRYGSTPHLTKEQRIRLWRGDENTNDLLEWSWVFGDNETDWDDFREGLIQDVAEDGFQLEFLQLAGPDHLRQNHFFTWGSYWTNHGLIVSDVARSADFTFGSHGKLLRIQGCVHWKLLNVDAEAVRRRTEQDVSALQLSMSQLVPPVYEALLKKNPNHFDDLTEKVYLEQKKRLKKIRVCHKQRNPQQLIRFIPAAITSRSDVTTIHNISATDVRRVISRGLQRLAANQCDLATLKEELGSMVLNPDTLLKIYVRPQITVPSYAEHGNSNGWA